MRKSKLIVSINRVLSFGTKVGVLAVVGMTVVSLGTSSAYAADFAHDTTMDWAGITTDGITYASEIFGPGSDVVLPTKETGVTPVSQPAVIYTDFQDATDQPTVFPTSFRVIYELDNNATFVEMPVYDDATAPPLVLDALAQGVDAAGTATLDTVEITGGPVAGGDKVNGGSTYNRAKFDIGVTNATSPSTSKGIVLSPTAGGPSLTLRYQIRASALASPGQKITMTMKITDIGELETYAMVERELVLATSEQGTTATIEPYTGTEANDYRVAVGSGSLEFISDQVDEATIGILKVKNASDVFCPNGMDLWAIGTKCAAVGTGGTDSGAKPILTISGGQFAASVNDPGHVKVGGSNQKASDEETISFELTDQMLTDIAETDGVPITIVADGKTEINVPENAPTAELLLSYDDATYQQTSVPAVDLLRIRRDGTVCTLYNVSPSNGSDDVSIRITNMSAVDGEVYGALYDKDANEIFPSTLLTNKDGVSIIKPKATLALFGPDIEKIAGTWSGRAILVLTTTLPDIDVLGLLRDKSSAAAPLTNLSTGVTGKSCVK